MTVADHGLLQYVSLRAYVHNMAQSVDGMHAIQASKPWQENT
jgi:hypothetical protein